MFTSSRAFRSTFAIKNDSSPDTHGIYVATRNDRGEVEEIFKPVRSTYESKSFFWNPTYDLAVEIFRGITLSAADTIGFRREPPFQLQRLLFVASNRSRSEHIPSPQP